MNLLALPILLPLVAAVLCLAVPGRIRLQALIAGLAVHAQLALAIPLVAATWDGTTVVLRVGGWPGAFGIVLACDLLGALMLGLTALLLVASWWFMMAGAIEEAQQRRLYHPLFLLLAAGIGWSFLTADLFNLFVSFELILMGSYALLSHGNDRLSLRAATRFAVLNIITGTTFLAGAGLTYGTFGTLNLGDLALAVQAHEGKAITGALAGLFLFVFATKAAAFPLFFWLPGAYPRLPWGIMPVFTGILTKVGVYALYRLFTIVFPGEVVVWLQPLLLAMAALTMLVGVLSALAQWSVRSILAFHSISQVGYMVFGLAIFTAPALGGGIFFVIHHALVKSTLFVIAAIIIAHYRTDALKLTRGVLADQPWLAILFLLAAFSLAGIPPLSGFYGKWILVVESISAELFWYAAASIVTSLFTLASMVKIWTTIFVGEPERRVDLGVPRNRQMVWVASGMGALLVLMVVFSGWLVEASDRAARGLADRQSYVAAVRGDFEKLPRVMPAAPAAGAEEARDRDRFELVAVKPYAPPPHATPPVRSYSGSGIGHVPDDGAPGHGGSR